MFRGKKYKDSAKQIDRAVQYEPADALGLVVKTARLSLTRRWKSTSSWV